MIFENRKFNRIKVKNERQQRRSKEFTTAAADKY